MVCISRSLLYGIDDGVAGDDDVLRRDRLGEQVVARKRSGRKVQLRDYRRQPPVYFFRPRLENIMAAQAGLDVRNWNLSIERGQSRRKSRRGVALH